MDKILSVEQVAEILGLRPFTVRKMFREGRLSGFKAGKAWRITESGLLREIERWQEEASSPAARSLSGDSARRTRQPAPSEAPSLLETASLPPGLIVEPEPELPVEAPPQPHGVGRMVVFSGASPLDVFLNGSHKGITTLSLVDVPEGEHELRVGALTDVIQIERDVELRVTAQEGQFKYSRRELSPQTVAGVCQLLIRMENGTTFSGPMTIYLYGKDAEDTAEMFRDYGEHRTDEGLRLVRQVSAEGELVLFDGPVHYLPDTRLYVWVPRQPGLEKESRHAFSLGSSLMVTITLGGGGLLRFRPIIRIRKDSGPAV
ncbi:MAG: helix-turn-helix domain-containing protein [Candidatus Hydrogenedentes bacterium]|nr:helix-turn-helix domain-containing protein [Candidatus Hydrogenedentota bacterium]